MKVIIEGLHPKKGFIVKVSDGRAFEVKTMNEAISLKNELESKK